MKGLADRLKDQDAIRKIIVEWGRAVEWDYEDCDGPEDGEEGDAPVPSKDSVNELVDRICSYYEELPGKENPYL